MIRFCLAAALTFAALTAVAQAPAVQRAAAVDSSGLHTLNLKDADIQTLIATVSEITGKNFIIGPNVQGKVTVISAKPMKADEIYDVFLSVLRVHGYAAINSGSMVKIVPEAMAQQDGSGGLNGKHGHEPDELVTQIIPVQHVPATQLVPILRPLMPQGAQLIAHPASNSLVISDRAGNVERMISIIHRIDTVSDAGVEVIPLQHASASELARTLTQLAGNNAADADQPRVFADERTNSILLSGGKSGRLRMRALIAHLDTPVGGGGDTQVIYLNYASAKDLVPILQGVAATLTGDVQPGKAAAGAAVSAGSGASTATIQAHEGDNALVISAPPAVFRSLASVVRQLDIRRAQVLIEAVIAEVSNETANELGVQWQLPLGGNNHIIGGTNFTGPSAGNNIFTATGGLNNVASGGGIAPVSTLGNGFNLGYLDTISINGTKLLSLGALVSALASNGKNNVLSPGSSVRYRFLHDQHRWIQRRHHRHRQSVPDHPAQGCGPDLDRHAAREFRRCGAPGYPSGSLQSFAAGTGRGGSGHEQARTEDHCDGQGRFAAGTRRLDIRQRQGQRAESAGAG